MISIREFIIFTGFIVSTSSHLTAINDFQIHPKSSVGFQGCPNPESISPCICTNNGANGSSMLSMDCSHVQSEEQLKIIFQVEFPTINFWKFSMIGNTNIKVLANDILGPVTFEMFIIENGALETVEDGAFMASKGTAKSMYFINNTHHTKFPFQSIHKFITLDTLLIQGSGIYSPSGLSSTSLQTLGLDFNPLGSTLPANILQDIPRLVNVSLVGANLTHLEPGFISHNEHLEVVWLQDNNVSQLQAGVFQSSSQDIKIISVANNHIKDVEPQTFPVVEGLNIHLENNSIVYLNSSIWRPLTEGHVTLHLEGNPLACDCDLAWLVLDPWNQEYTPNATCDGGIPVSWLEPTVFEQCPYIQ